MRLNWASALPAAAVGAALAWASESRPTASMKAARRVILGKMFTRVPWQDDRESRTRRHVARARRRRPAHPFSVPRQAALEHAGGYGRLSAQVGLAYAHGTQIGRQVTLGDLGEHLAGGCAGGDAIGAEVAKIPAQTTPRAQRPLAAPERQAQRFDLAHAGLAGLVAVIQPQHLAADDGRVQLVDQGGEILAMLVAPHRGEDART